MSCVLQFHDAGMTVRLMRRKIRRVLGCCGGPGFGVQMLTAGINRFR
jgi:hypothetical protein